MEASKTLELSRLSGEQGRHLFIYYDGEAAQLLMDEGFVPSLQPSPVLFPLCGSSTSNKSSRRFGQMM